MSAKVRSSLLAAAMVVSVGGFGCNGSMTDEELAINEASSYQALTQEDGDVTGDVPEEVPEAAAAEDAELAAGGPGRVGVCNFSEERQRVLERYDTNGDGKLDRSELRALKADLGDRPGIGVMVRQRARALLRLRWLFDTNGDKQLSAEERTAMVDAMQARCDRLRQKALENFDADHDGSLNDAERAALKASIEARHAQRRQQLLADYDANGNGRLDEAEVQKLRTDRQARRQSRRVAVLAQYDTDGDGKLSAAEAATLRQEILRRLTEGADAEA